MGVSWESLTVGTKVNIITDCTLVADTLNIALSRLVLAKWTVTEDSVVDIHFTGLIADSLIDRSKSVTRVATLGMGSAVTAVVPVRAAQAFVTNTNDALVTSITDSCVLELTTWKAARHYDILQAEVAVNSRQEFVGRVVTMLVPHETTKAQVIVFTVIAADQVCFIGLCIIC